MASALLTLDTIGDLDGGAARAVIDRAIEDAVRDCDDRGTEDGKPRKVVITLNLERVGDSIAATVEAKWSAPSFKTKQTVGRLLYTPGLRAPQVEFQPLAPDNPDQRTIDFPETKAK